MFSNLDNLDYNIIESLSIINQEKNEFQLNFNNYNYFSLNLNNFNQNDNKDPPQSNAVNNCIYFNNNKNLNVSNEQGNSNNHEQIKNNQNKSKKIFRIINIKRKNVDNANLEEIDNKDNKLPRENNQVKNENEIISNKNDDARNNIILNNSEDNKKNSKQKHNKFSDDNLRKKCKHLVLSSVLEFINNKIFDIYEGNIGNNIYRKELLINNKNQKMNSNIIFNREFIDKKISDIFSEIISTRYTNYLPEHNKLLIERLKNEEDENKRIYFNKLFNLTFNECLNHFIGKKSIDELQGMKCFEVIKDTLGDNPEYIKILRYYLNNFHNIVYNKNPRKPKTNKKKENYIE